LNLGESISKVPGENGL